jgi:GntR family transcriptional regulator
MFIAYLFSESGEVVDYSYSYFLPGYFRFHVVRSVGSKMTTPQMLME